VTESKTMALDKALHVRKRVKSKKPDFVRQESWRYYRLKENWRRPRGIDNKMRRKIKGWPATPNAGYRGPKATRNIHPSGYQEVLVYNVGELKKVDPKTNAVRIAHTVGKKARAGILLEARKRKITILNPGEVKKEKVTEEKEEEIVEKEIETAKEKRKSEDEGRKKEQ